MSNAQEINQTPVPIWVQSPYSNYAYNVEPMLRLMAEKNYLATPFEVLEDLDFVQEIFLQNIQRNSLTETHELSDCIYTLRNVVKFFQAIAYKKTE